MDDEEPLREDAGARRLQSRLRANAPRFSAPADFDTPLDRPQLRRARLRPDAATIFGAAFGALMLAIGVNALALQRERHPAPLFDQPRAEAPRRPAIPADPHGPDQRLGGAPAASEPVPAAAGAAPPSPTPPPAKPPERPRDATASLDKHPKDPIGDLLHSGKTPVRPGKEPSPAVAAIQRTLKKLGYKVEVDGRVGPATSKAIARFEHDHRMPVKGQLTARLFKEITAADGPKP
jgi:Putative peptidoglycan binding domain